MAIKTEVPLDELEAVAADWGLGTLATARGLPEGSINTLYSLETATGRYVLRLSEGRAEREVAFETDLLAHLATHRYPAVRLVPRADGRRYGVVRGRFACVFRWAAGEHVLAAKMSPEQAWDAGRLLGRLHVATEDFAGSLDNRYSPAQIEAWVRELSAGASTGADADLRAALPMLEREAAALGELPASAEGVIHADWFPDNLSFVGDRIATVLDFEMACRAPFVFDLATAIHACCYDEDYVPVRARALVGGYREERRITAAERETLHPWARFSALRFTVTRIRDFHLAPLGGDRLFKKDWRRFRARLEKTVAMRPHGFRALCGL